MRAPNLMFKNYKHDIQWTDDIIERIPDNVLAT